MAAGAEGFPRAHWDVVGPRYFSTIGTPLLSGRDFTDLDVAGAPPVVVINDAMARRFFGAANPLGRRLLWNVADTPVPLEIVAVARDAKPDGPRREPELRFYLPYFQLPAIRGSWNVASLRLLVRTSASPAALADGLRQAIATEEPRLSMTSVVLGPELVARALVRERMVATLLVAFGSLAVGLACLGLYGVIAYRVVQRTNEIGIRMALGASRRDVLRATLGQALAWIAAGVAVGVPLALGAARLAASLLFGLSATDPTVLGGAAVLMSALGLIAAYLPARRASTRDPLVALRHE
jgi:putative ABC transport system permease protein